MDHIICHLNNQTKNICLYKKFKIFKDKISQEFKIPMNDIIIYIFFNGLKIEIDESTYNEYIVEDTSIDEVYCELTSQNEKEQLIQNIQQSDEKIKKYEKEIKRYKEKIKDLEEKYYKLKVNFDEYKKLSNQKINGLYDQILKLEYVLKNKQNIPSQIDYNKNEEIPINRKKNVKTPKNNDYNLTNSELRRQCYNNYSNYNNSSNNNNDINYNNSRNNNNDINYNNSRKNNNNINYNNISNNNNFDDNNNSNSLYSSNKANNNLINKVKKKLSCKIIIKEPIIMKNIKEIGNKLPIRVIIKIYNDGKNQIPKQCDIISQSDSNLFIIDTLVNNGNVILAGQIIEVSLYIFFRDYNNIPTGISTLNIYLYNKNDGKIGEDGQIKINILPSDLFISQSHPNFRNSYNEFNIIPNNSSLLSSYQKNN